MRKLKVALVLLFSMCFSLFLYACGGNTSGVVSVSISGVKTTYEETATADDFTTEGMVVGVIYKEGMEKDENGKIIPVELEPEEYTVDASRVQWGTPGSYFVRVTPNGQKEAAEKEGVNLTTEVYGEFTLTIEHAFEDKGNGLEECEVCGAQRETLEIADTIVSAAWGAKQTVSAPDGQTVYAKGPAEGDQFVTYGSIGMGQSITLTMTIKEIDTSAAWNTPLMGIRSGNKGLLPREDNWVIATGPNAAETNFVAPNNTPTGGVATVGEATTESTEWVVYNKDGNMWNASDMVDGTLEVTYNYREDGIMEIIHVLNGSNTIHYSINLPNAAYDVIAYGEKVTVEVTKVVVVRNLLLQEFNMLSAPDKLVYAENTMFDLTGLKAKAVYNKGIESEITTYEIYADTETLNNIDLRTNLLTADMENFRITFSGEEIALDVQVVESPILYASNNAPQFGDFSDSLPVYDATAEGELAIVISGKAYPNFMGMGEGMHMVLFRLATEIGANITNVQVFDAANVEVEDSAMMIDGNVADQKYILVAIGIDAVEGVYPNYALKITTGTGEDAVEYEFVIDLSALAVPEVMSMVNPATEVTLDGGTAQIQYAGEALMGDIDDYTVYVGTRRAKIEALKAATVSAPVELGDVLVTECLIDADDGMMMISFVLPAPDFESNFANKYVVTLRDTDGNTVAEDTLNYSWAIEDMVEVAEGVYVYAKGTKLVLVAPNNNENILAGAGFDLLLNVQNENAEAFDVSMSLGAADGAFASVNKLTSASKAKASVSGTIGNVDDTDVGYALIGALDVRALGLRNTNETATQTYYFEVVETKGVVGAIYKVEGNVITAASMTPDEDSKEGATGDCLVGGLEYYVDAATGFKYGQAGGAAHGNHTFVEGVCSECGSTRFETTTNGMQVAAIDKNLADRGLTVSFTVSGATADWTSAVITTSKNFIITLPNVDPWNNTSGEYTGVNAFPGVDVNVNNLFNGGAWNSFLGDANNTVTAHVTIVISATQGVVFYKDGVKVIHYPATQAMGTGTMGGLATVMLNDIAENGFTFANGADVGTVTNLEVYTAAFDDAAVLENWARTAGTVLTPNATVAHTSGTWFDAIYDTTLSVQKGYKMIISGTGSCANVVNNWDTIMLRLADGFVFRADNFGWVDGASTMEAYEQVETTFGVDQEVADIWVPYKEIIANYEYTWVVDYTDEEVVNVSLTMTNGVYTWSQTYAVEAAADQVLADSYLVTVHCENSQFTVAKIVSTAPVAAE